MFPWHMRHHIKHFFCSCNLAVSHKDACLRLLLPVFLIFVYEMNNLEMYFRKQLAYENSSYGICRQQRITSACTSVQSSSSVVYSTVPSDFAESKGISQSAWTIAPDKRSGQNVIFLISPWKHILWVLIRTLPRHFQWVPTTVIRRYWVRPCHIGNLLSWRLTLKYFL